MFCLTHAGDKTEQIFVIHDTEQYYLLWCVAILNLKKDLKSSSDTNSTAKETRLQGTLNTREDMS